MSAITSPSSNLHVDVYGPPGRAATIAARLGAAARPAAAVSWHREGAHAITRLPVEPLRASDLLIPALMLWDVEASAWQAALVWEHAHGQHRVRLAATRLGAMTAPAASPMTREKIQGVRAAVDCFELETPVTGATLEITLMDIRPLTAAALERETAVVLSRRAFRYEPPAPLPAPDRPPVELAVPVASQRTQPAAIAGAICSPTAVAMVLAYWRSGAAEDVEALARDARCEVTGLFGVWPANLAAARRRGLQGVVRCFDDFAEAHALLAMGFPLVVSLRFGAGALPGAALERTSGHLVVLRGVRGETVLVNDPAAPDSASVPRELSLAAFTAAWLAERGVAYVLWPLAHGAGHARADAAVKLPVSTE